MVFSVVSVAVGKGMQGALMITEGVNNIIMMKV